MKKHIEIVNGNGAILRGYYNKPKDFKGKCVVFFHGYTGHLTEHGGMFRDFSEILATEGIASLRLDYSGNGESDGHFSAFTLHTLMQDGSDILSYANNSNEINEIILLGYSLGGALAAYMAGNANINISRLLLWSPSGEIGVNIRRVFEKAPKLENGNVESPNFELSKAMYDSTFECDLNKGLENYSNPVLIIQGRKDMSVDYLDAYRYSGWFQKARVHIVEEAGHGYDTIAARQELFKESIQFIRGNSI